MIYTLFIDLLQMLDINLLNEKDLEFRKKNHDEVINGMDNKFNNDLMSKKKKYDQDLKIKMNLEEVYTNQLSKVTSDFAMKKSKIEEVHKYSLESEKTRVQKLSKEQKEFMKMFEGFMK